MMVKVNLKIKDHVFETNSQEEYERIKRKGIADMLSKEILKLMDGGYLDVIEIDNREEELKEYILGFLVLNDDDYKKIKAKRNAK